MTSVHVSIFNKETFGLPDSCILDEYGNLSQAHFEKTLSIPRKFKPSRGKSIRGTLQPTIEMHSDRKSRASHFCSVIKTLVEADRPIIPAGDPNASWEAQVFNRFIKDWHLKPMEECPSWSALGEQEREKITGSFREFAGVGSDALLRVTYELYVKLQNDLDNWARFNDDGQKLLADVVFGCFTLFGPDVIRMAIKKVPTLFEYYSYLMTKINPEVQTSRSGNAKASNPAEAVQVTALAVEVPIESKLEGSEAVVSMLSFYEQIGVLATAGISRVHDMTIADRIEELVVTHLPRLRKSQEMPSTEVKALFSDFASCLISVGRKLQLTWFSEEAFLGIFNEVWADFFNERLKTEIPVDHFTLCFNAICATAKIAGEEFFAAKAKLESACSITETRRNALEKAGFRQKRGAEAELVAAQMIESKRKLELSAAEIKATEALLPEIGMMEALPDDGYVANFDQSQFHPSATSALMAWRNSRMEAVIFDVESKNTPCVNEGLENQCVLTKHLVPEKGLENENPIDAQVGIALENEEDPKLLPVSRLMQVAPEDTLCHMSAPTPCEQPITVANVEIMDANLTPRETLNK